LPLLLLLPAFTPPTLRAGRSCKHLKQLGIDSTNQVSRHVLMEIKKTFPNLATKTRP
jgi:hypothetical protein